MHILPPNYIQEGFYVYVYTVMYMYIHVLIHIYIYIHVCIYIYTLYRLKCIISYFQILEQHSPCMYERLCYGMYIHVYIYIYIYIYTYTHTISTYASMHGQPSAIPVGGPAHYFGPQYEYVSSC